MGLCNSQDSLTLERALKADRVLVFGIGGGGDIVGSIPTARFFELNNSKVFTGGIAWERIPNDPTIGPRSLEELENLEKLSDTVAFVDSDTKLRGEGEITEVQVSKYYDNKTILIDITKGMDKLIKGVKKACNKLDIDLIIGVDVGGDVLAKGNEKGLKSPLADSIALKAMKSFDRSILGVFGYGSDGELSVKNLNKRVKKIAKKEGLIGSWGLTTRTIEEMEGLLTKVNTEASLLPVEAAKGKLGKRKIRNDRRSVFLTPASTVTFYFRPNIVADFSDLISIIDGYQNISEASEKLNQVGIETEIDIERRILKENN